VSLRFKEGSLDPEDEEEEKDSDLVEEEEKDSNLEKTDLPCQSRCRRPRVQ